MANTILIRKGTGMPNQNHFVWGEPAFNGENLFVKDNNSYLHMVGYRPYVETGCGTVYLTDDNTWMCPIGSTTYGDNILYGTGSVPDYDYMQKAGFWVPKGSLIQNLVFGGMCSEDNLTGLRLYVDQMYSTDSNWYSGMVSVTPSRLEVLDIEWTEPDPFGSPFTNNLENYHRAKIVVDHEVTEDSYISLYVKPDISGTPTNAAFKSHWSFEILGYQRKITQG